MTQSKRTRQRRQKPQLSAEELAYCDEQITLYESLLERRMEKLQYYPAFLFEKLREWRILLYKRGGDTE